MSTPVQEKVFTFIRDTFEARGSAPTFDEIAAHLGSSTVWAWKVVSKLVEQGRLIRRGGRGNRRYIEIPGRVDLKPVPTGALVAELARRRAVSHAEGAGQ